jgi:hypothetical protein
MDAQILKIWSDETKNNNKTFRKSVQSVTNNTRTKQLQNLSLFTLASTPVLPHRKPASAGPSRNRFGSQASDKRNALYLNRRNEIITSNHPSVPESSFHFYIYF